MNGPARNFRDLVVWQKAHELVLAVYRLTRAFPDHEKFGLTSQIRRAAVSVAANVAEGFSKRSRPDKLRFFNIAEGSLAEVHYYLILVGDLGYAECPDLLDLREEVARLLARYAAAIQTTASRLLTPDSCLLTPVSCLLTPVSCLLTPVS